MVLEAPQQTRAVINSPLTSLRSFNLLPSSIGFGMAVEGFQTRPSLGKHDQRVMDKLPDCKMAC